MTIDNVQMCVNRYHQEGGGGRGSSLNEDQVAVLASSFIYSDSREGRQDPRPWGGAPSLIFIYPEFVVFPAKGVFGW